MPSTLLALRSASAPSSTARSAAVVSVVKNGLPVPAAKITTRPFRDGESRETDVGLGQLLHGDCALDSGGHTCLLQCVAEGGALMTVASIPM